jgi:hypothetical protein
MANTLRSIFWSVIGILVSGGIGAWCGVLLVGALGLSGVGAALVGAVTGMVVATAVWLALTLALRKARNLP